MISLDPVVGIPVSTVWSWPSRRLVTPLVAGTMPWSTELRWSAPAGSPPWWWPSTPPWCPGGRSGSWGWARSSPWSGCAGGGTCTSAASSRSSWPPRSSLCWSPGHDQLGCGSSAGGRGSVPRPAGGGAGGHAGGDGLCAAAVRPAGSRGTGAVGGVLFVLGLPGCTSAVEHPTDLLAAVILGVAVGGRLPLLHPQRGLRSPTGAPRPRTWTSVAAAQAIIRTAVQEQLGLTVLDVQPVGLEGSAGSTPLRLRIAASDGAPERDLFAKLYAKPRPRRPVPQAGPHDPVRRAGGRGPLPVGPPLCRVRGLHAAAAAPRRHPGAGRRVRKLGREP